MIDFSHVATPFYILVDYNLSIQVIAQLIQLSRENKNIVKCNYKFSHDGGNNMSQFNCVLELKKQDIKINQFIYEVGGYRYNWHNEI